MRISDWSSDVCSSDLPPAASAAGPASPVTPGSPGTQPGTGARFAFSGLEHGFDRRSDSQAPLEWSGGASVWEHWIMRTGVIAKKMGMTRLFQDDGRHVPVTVLARSAEHTSELQSLMRISYAVFCLKKHTQSQN